MTILASEIKIQRLCPVFHLAGHVDHVGRCQCQGFGELFLLQAQWFAPSLPVRDRSADVTGKVSPSPVNYRPCEQRNDRSNFTKNE